MLVGKLLVLAALVVTEAFHVASHRPVVTARSLFGGGKKEGGALSSVAGVVDQYKKAQQIAKKSAELQAELGKTVVEASSEDGKITMKISGQQTPVGAEIASLDGYDAATLSDQFTSAIKNAQAKSLEEMNAKLQALYAEIGGAEDPASGG
ncbi:hypothetical protein CTAYLR_007939 [Chrysophaeum taylorii]|uniref:Uncharacterized protein n=1 Tax=Chrysophaeum taylorii TaxID=2483200 RepID=A0AAD7XPQ9_9STRA|nr:hypothetical protein CTAYLR_007939 [Chrysophaeum taylorii]